MQPLKQKIFLLKNLVKVELSLRYKKSILGNLWYILTPMIYAGLYYFAFSYVFSARSGREDNLTNMVVLFWGVSLHSYLAEILNRATTLIASNTNYVKKTIFPLELLCFCSAITGLVQLVTSTLITLIILAFTPVNLLAILPVIALLLPFVVICIGMSLLFSAFGVFIKDLASMSSILVSMLLFISPVLYNLDRLPTELQGFLYLNPITAPLQTLREIITGQLDTWTYCSILAIYSVAAIAVIFCAGFIFFKMKRHFVDVL